MFLATSPRSSLRNGALEIDVNPYALSRQGIAGIRAFYTCDVCGVRILGAFSAAHHYLIKARGNLGESTMTEVRPTRPLWHHGKPVEAGVVILLPDADAAYRRNRSRRAGDEVKPRLPRSRLGRKSRIRTDFAADSPFSTCDFGVPATLTLAAGGYPLVLGHPQRARRGPVGRRGDRRHPFRPIPRGGISRTSASRPLTVGSAEYAVRNPPLSSASGLDAVALSEHPQPQEPSATKRSSPPPALALAAFATLAPCWRPHRLYRKQAGGLGCCGQTFTPPATSYIALLFHRTAVPTPGPHRGIPSGTAYARGRSPRASPTGGHAIRRQHDDGEQRHRSTTSNNGAITWAASTPPGERSRRGLDGRQHGGQPPDLHQPLASLNVSGSGFGVLLRRPTSRSRSTTDEIFAP